METVEEIAQGRVWSGKDAVEIGLVDSLGGLNEAIASAAEMAILKNTIWSIIPNLMTI